MGIAIQIQSEGSEAMKITRILALAAIALLAVGIAGVAASQTLAQTTPSLVQTGVTDAVGTGLAVAPVSSQAAGQVQDQSAPDTAEAGTEIEDQNAPETGTEATAPDTDTVEEQAPSYQSSITVDAQYDGKTEADEAAALAGQATITPDQAKTAALAANSGTSVVKVELDNENGALVYSVELNNGLDVKVDAGNGTVLHVDSGED
jgi:uncharacterized membrane protein YkoI